MQKNKKNTLNKAGIIAITLILTSFVNITIATSSISNHEEVADYVTEQLELDKDEYLIYVWGPINEGEEVVVVGLDRLTLRVAPLPETIMEVR